MKDDRQKKMRLVPILFSQEQINEAVEIYRSRVRSEDADDLKQLLMRTAFRQCCDLKAVQDRGLQLLEQLCLTDMRSLFEPSDAEVSETSETSESDTAETTQVETGIVDELKNMGNGVPAGSLKDDGETLSENDKDSGADAVPKIEMDAADDPENRETHTESPASEVDETDA